MRGDSIAPITRARSSKLNYASDDTEDGDGNAGGSPRCDTDSTHEIERSELPSEAVVRSAASVANTPISDLGPLYGVVNSDHLNNLLDRKRRGALRNGGRSPSNSTGVGTP